MSDAERKPFAVFEVSDQIPKGDKLEDYEALEYSEVWYIPDE